MVISHNMMAMNAQIQFNMSTDRMKKVTERLSSGYKINRASDDAAGLSISENMRRQIRGLTRGSQNVQDGVSLTQVADGALNEVHSMIHRIRELAIQAANGTNSDEDRQSIQSEIRQIKGEISRTFNDTDFNGFELFKSPYTLGVVGEPSDTKIFNTTQSNDISARGGLLIDNRRYTWNELGASVVNGQFTADYEHGFVTPDGEQVFLSAKQGEYVDSIARTYQVSADEHGIKINNIPTARWSNTSASGEWAGVDEVIVEDNTYSFYHHGMDISFEIEEGDDLDRIIDKINSESSKVDGTMHFTTTSGGGKEEIAVISCQVSQSMIIDVTKENRYDIMDFEYILSADDTGVSIIQTQGDDGISHKKILWSEFRNVSTGEEFRFTDWGLEDEGENPKTFSSQATYRYEDNLVDGMSHALSFEFTVADEASKESIINGINNKGIEGFREVFVEKIRSNVTTDNPNVTPRNVYVTDSFEYQRDVLGRTFDDGGDTPAPIEGEVNITRHYCDPALYVSTYIKTHTMKEVYVKRINEVLDDEEIPTGEVKYTYELYSSQDINDSGIETNSEGRRIHYSYENDGGGKLATYKSNESEYTKVLGQLYEINDSGTVVGDDDEHTTYGEATGSDQKYIIIADTMSLDKIFRTYYERKSYINADGEKVEMSVSHNPQRVDVIDGVVDWKGRSVDTSYIGKPESFLGRPTQFYHSYDHLYDYYVDCIGIHTNFELGMDRDNSNEESDGSVNQMYHTYIYPSQKASRFFSLHYLGGGSSYHTIFDMEAAPPPPKNIHIHSGSREDDGIDMVWEGMSLASIGLGSANVTTRDRSLRTINMCDKALEKVSRARSIFGAYQNRLEHTMASIDNTAENVQAAESRIRDADLAKEMVEFSKHKMLEQVGESMISQANQSQQGILNLLQ